MDFFLKREKIVDAEALILIPWSVDVAWESDTRACWASIFVRGGPNFGIKG